jgi:hypothetical protein
MKSETAGLKTKEDTSGEVSPGEIKDPMSGYAGADVLGAEPIEGSAEVTPGDELKDPMSGYSSADVLGPGARVNEEGVDKVHADEMKDAMSGYASADALESDEK